MSDPAEILGVEIKFLKSHPDNRGFFREVIRVTDDFFAVADGTAPFAQWSHSKMSKNVVKAWHYHHVQTDWWYIGVGCAEAVLYDWRPESPTYKSKIVITLGDSSKYAGAVEACVKIPPGVLHALKVLTDEAHLFYITSTVYNPQDEGRIPYNSELIPHDWGTDAITCENDRKTFEPTLQRKKIAR